MPINLGGGYAAGGGADALEGLWRLIAEQADAEQRRKHEGERLKLDARRVEQDGELRRIALEDRADARADAQQKNAQAGALKIAGQLRPRSLITPEQGDALAAGGLGDKIVAPTLDSRNIGQGMASTPNPGRGESFAGLPDQLEEDAQDAERERQMTLQPKLRGRLQMVGMLPRANRAGAMTEILREEAKAPPKSAALQEYEDAKANGFAGSFTDYQNADANRKRPVVNVTAATNANNSNAMKLADDYTRDSKDYVAQNAAMRRINASAADPSAAGDMSLLYGYMKMLDPNSVVRETEFATAAQSGSLPQQIQGAATKVLNGQRLTPEQRKDFVDRARRLYAEAETTNKAIRESYTQRARKFGVDPSLVFTDIGGTGPATTPAAGGRVYYDANGNPIKK